MSTSSPHPPLSWHLRETLKLAAPIILARSALLVMFTVDTLMTGWVSADELAALGIGCSPYLVLMLVTIGALQSVVVLVSQAMGGGRLADTGAVLRAGLVHAAGLGLLILATVPIAERFFLATGQTATLASAAAEVSFHFAWGMLGMLLFVAVNLFLEATGRARVGMIAMVAVNILNIPLNGVFGLGWGGLVEPMGAAGMIAVSSALRWAAFFACLVFLIQDQRRLSDPHTVFAPIGVWLAEARAGFGPAGRRIRSLGLPMGIAQGIESAAFATVVFFAGRLGTIELAAYQVTMTLVTLVYMMAIGIAGAASIRVGHAIGAGQGAEARRAGFTAIGLGALAPLPVVVLFFLAPGSVAGVFSTDPGVITLMLVTLPIAASFMPFDGMMGVTTGALRGAGDAWVPMIAQALAFWFVAIPIAYVFGLHGSLGLPGLLIGILAGILASLAIMVPRFALISARARALA